jgi:hypothetical protein
MTYITAWTMPGSLSLVDLQTRMQQLEGALGKLTNIGNNNTDTVIDIDQDVDPPTKPIELRMTIGGRALGPPAGYMLVCQGDCIVASQKTNLAAYRLV